MKKICTLSIATILFSCFDTQAQSPTLQWATQIISSIDEAEVVDLATDSAGNIYLTGNFMGSVDFDPGPGTFNLFSGSSSTRDLFYAKYTSSGNFVWAFDLGGPATQEFGKSIVVKGSYIYLGCTESSFISIRKMDLNGAAVWTQSYSPGTSGRLLSELTVDNAGNVYICGEYSGSEVWGFVRKYSPSGAVIQTQTLGSFGATSSSGLSVSSVTTDTSGGVYITGNYNYPSFFPNGVFTPYPYSSVYYATQFFAKLDSSLLTCSYVYNVARASGTTLQRVGNDKIYNVRYDITTNTIVLQGVLDATLDFDFGPGVFSISPASEDHFIAKYTPAAGFVWAINFPISGFGTEADISLDNSGNIYFTGELSSATTDMHPTQANPINTRISSTSDVIFAKYTSTGSYAWSTNLGGSTSVASTYGICADPSGAEVLLCGGQRWQIDFDPSASTVNLGNTNIVSSGYFVKYSACSGSPLAPGTISGTATVCAGSSNTYSISPVSGATSYTWTLPGGWTGTSATTSISATAGATSGNITVTADNACGSSTAQTFSVTVSNPALTLTPASTTCFGSCDGSITANTAGGISPYTYSPSLTNLCANNYTVTVTDNIGCTSQQTTTITEPSVLTANATANAPAFCNGGCTDLSISESGGTAPYMYSWMPGNMTSATPNVCPSTTTTYTCTVTDANLCTTTSTVTVTVNQLPAVTYTQSPAFTCINWNPITLSAGSPSGGTYSGPGVSGTQFDPAAAGQGTWDVVYTYTDGNGCADSVTQQIVVDLCTGINQQVNENEMVAYPNPTNGTVTVSGVEVNATITVYNTLGEIIHTQIMSPGKTLIDLAAFPAGVYFLQATSGNGFVTKKIVKE